MKVILKTYVYFFISVLPDLINELINISNWIELCSSGKGNYLFANTEVPEQTAPVESV